MIVGGGFGGLNAAQGLKRVPVDVTLIDRHNHHLFQPLLYQVATGGLSPADIASPIRHVLRRQRNARVLMDNVVGIDLDARVVRGDHTATHYDTLVISTGARHHYFGNDSWEDDAPGLKTLDDALHIRARVLRSFEEAERGDVRHLTFLVVGGGPTGLEMAGTIAEMAHHSLAHEYKSIDRTAIRVVLVEATDRLLQPYPPELSEKARVQLADLGVEVRLNWQVTDIDGDRVTMSDGAETEVVHTAVTVWAAGVKASSLAQELQSAGAEFDRAGRVIVTPELTVPSHPEIFVIGDTARVEIDEKVIPGVAPAAIQMGRYVAKTIGRRVRGQETPPFRYVDRGNLATIGRSAAVADIGPLHFSGWPAWVAWLGIHLFFLIGFENKLLVMVQWAGNYITRNRSARIIR